jgi:hypothetical protein
MSSPEPISSKAPIASRKSFSVVFPVSLFTVSPPLIFVPSKVILYFGPPLPLKKSKILPSFSIPNKNSIFISAT